MQLLGGFSTMEKYWNTDRRNSVPSVSDLVRRFPTNYIVLRRSRLPVRILDSHRAHLVVSPLQFCVDVVHHLFYRSRLAIYVLNDVFRVLRNELLSLDGFNCRACDVVPKSVGKSKGEHLSAEIVRLNAT